MERTVRKIQDALLSSEKSAFSIFMLSTAVFLASFYLFYVQVHGVESDIPTHNEFLMKMEQGEMMLRPHLLYYGVLWLFSFGALNLELVHWTSILLLSFMVLIKFHVIRSFFRRRLATEAHSYPFLIALLAMAMVVLFNPPPGITPNFKLGQIPPNVWHNSTGIFLVPFAILLYDRAERYIWSPEAGDRRLLSSLALLSFTNVLIKPTFFIPYMGAFFCMLLIRFRLRKPFWLGSMTLLAGLVPMILQFLFFFGPDGSGRGIGIEPFRAWSQWSDKIPLSLLVSVLFPLSYILLRFRKCSRELNKAFAGLIFLIGLSIYILFVEEGKLLAQNFNKSAVQANMIFHLVFIGNFAKDLVRKAMKLDRSDWILLAFFLLNVVAGLLYLVKLPIYGYR